MLCILNVTIKYCKVFGKRYILRCSQASLVIEKYRIFNVKITGSCCELPEAIDTLVFSSPVRERQTRALNIENDTTVNWDLKPEITGDFFTVVETVHVPSKKSAICTVIYAPLIMNNETNPHKVTRKCLA